jgi:predicted secreted hydrolase
MRNRLVAAIALWLAASVAGAGQEQYRVALPGYKYEFPKDNFNHPDFQTEWWYYTGNVTAANGQRFGFELTFFRQGVSREAGKSAWDVRDIYLAHLALSDLDGPRFYFQERANRAGPGIAGASEQEHRIWNGNWSSEWNGNTQMLRAISQAFSLDLRLQTEKPPVVNGMNGVSQKAEGRGKASHYISLTRLKTTGTIEIRGKKIEVTGLAWMDHEFFTHQLETEQTGWDWFSMQMDDNTELMLYRIRREDGGVDPHSAGTYVDAEGKSQHLERKDFELEPEAIHWVSAATEARYPMRWRITVPKLGIEMEAAAALESQELTGNGFTPNYWEGAITVTGKRAGAALKGVGYLEMTGYDKPVVFGR